MQTQESGFPNESQIYTAIARIESLSTVVFGVKEGPFEYFSELISPTWESLVSSNNCTHVHFFYN